MAFFKNFDFNNIVHPIFLLDDNEFENIIPHSEPKFKNTHVIPNKCQKNYYLLLADKIPEQYKPFFVIIVITILQILISLYYICLRKYGAKGIVDIAFLGFTRTIITTILVLITASILEGKIKLRPFSSLGLLGLANPGLEPFTVSYISIYIGAEYALIYSVFANLAISIGSYVFRLEPLPCIRKPGSLLLFFGQVISVSSSFSILFLNYISKERKELKTEHYIWFTLIGCANMVSNAFKENYQIVKFVKNKQSALFGKPLTTIALQSLFSMPILIICYLISVIVRWNLISPYILKKENWLIMMFGIIFSTFLGKVLTGVCRVLTSPLFTSNAIASRLIIGSVLSYLILNEKMMVVQYILLFVLIFGILTMLFGKYMIAKFY